MTARKTYAEIYLKDPGEKRINLQGCRLSHDEPFVERHRYRTVRKLDMGPVVAAALAALGARRAV